jgi:hypothetical protein
VYINRETLDYGLSAVNFGFFSAGLNAIATAAGAAGFAHAPGPAVSNPFCAGKKVSNEQNQSRQSGGRNGRRRDDPDHLEIHQRQADPSLSRH